MPEETHLADSGQGLPVGSVPLDGQTIDQPAQPTEGDKTADGTKPTEGGAKTYKWFGREFDADSFYQEMTGNFLPDYTRTKQRLAASTKTQKQSSELDGLSEEQRQAKVLFDQLRSEAAQSAKEDILPVVRGLETKMEISRMKAQYPDFDEDKVARFAIDRNIYSSLEDAYKLMNYEKSLAEASAEGSREASYNAGLKRQAGTVPSADSGKNVGRLSSYDPAKDKGKSLKELFDEGFNELGL